MSTMTKERMIELKTRMVNDDVQQRHAALRNALTSTIADLQREVRRLDEDNTVSYYMVQNLANHLAEHQRRYEASLQEKQLLELIAEKE